METHVSKWGNSLAVRLPSSVAKEAKLTEGEAVELTVEAGRVVITPRAARYTLEQLMRGVTSGNLHGEADLGPAVGSEVW